MSKNRIGRDVSRAWTGQPTIEGAGVHLRRAFPGRGAPELDPFLLLDCFHSSNRKDYEKGFPWHPHRGMETITYVLDGDVEHGDSLGNKGLISSGDVQWMTAGSGIIHQEMPKGSSSGDMWGFQLWSNLPRSGKMMDPRYQEVKNAQIPTVKTADGASVRIVAGEVEGTQGPVKDIMSNPQFLDVALPAGKTFERAVDPGHTVFAYVIEGEGFFDAEKSRRYQTDSIVHFGPGDRVHVTASDTKNVRFLLVSGKPLGEPVAWHGPIVMNTQDELVTAFEELDRGTFVKVKAGR